MKVTLIAQLAPAARDAPQLLVCAKAAGLAPAIPILVIESAAVPVFFSVETCAGLVPPTPMLPKLSDPGVSTATGAGAAVPEPLSTTVCGEPLALSVTARAALKLATDVGANVMEMLQLAPAASDAPQVLVCAKLPAFAPVRAMSVMDRAAAPELVNVTVCVPLVVFTV